MIAYDVVAENDEVGRSAVDDAKRKEQVQMARKHVFVVDSAGAFLSLARDLLQDEAYNVTTTNYVPRTFDQIAALGPDLLVVDLAVGQRAGWDLLEQLQAGALTHDIPV
ncbi:MAG: hypothetical protein QOG89_2516, partial [Thermomicrobiales bacterium]|nr:hypothetical protein [Thermomicrobiales bacterium]